MDALPEPTPRLVLERARGPACPSGCSTAANFAPGREPDAARYQYVGAVLLLMVLGNARRGSGYDGQQSCRGLRLASLAAIVEPRVPPPLLPGPVRPGGQGAWRAGGASGRRRQRRSQLHHRPGQHRHHVAPFGAGRSLPVGRRCVRLTGIRRFGARAALGGGPGGGRPAARQGGGTAAVPVPHAASAGRSATSGVRWGRRRRRSAGKLPHRRRRRRLPPGRPASPRGDDQRARGAPPRPSGCGASPPPFR